MPLRQDKLPQLSQHSTAQHSTAQHSTAQHSTAKRSYDAAYVKLKFLVLIGLYPLDAYAYFDPGTGSLLMQLVIALVAGGAIFLRNITGKISVQWQKF